MDIETPVRKREIDTAVASPQQQHVPSVNRAGKEVYYPPGHDTIITRREEMHAGSAGGVSLSRETVIPGSATKCRFSIFRVAGPRDPACTSMSLDRNPRRNPSLAALWYPCACLSAVPCPAPLCRPAVDYTLVYRILILPLIGLMLIPASRPCPPIHPKHPSTALVVDIDSDISVCLTNFRFALLIWML